MFYFGRFNGSSMKVDRNDFSGDESQALYLGNDVDCGRLMVTRSCIIEKPFESSKEHVILLCIAYKSQYSKHAFAGEAESC